MTSGSKALRAAPALAALGAMFIFATPQVRAEDHRDCRDRIDHAQSKLDHEIDEHGPDSLQARHARHELHEAQEKCDSRDYNNSSVDNGAYRDRRYNDQYNNNGQYDNQNGQYQNQDNRPYSNTDDGQYRPNDQDNRPYNNTDNGQYRDNRPPDDPNYNNNGDNGQYQPQPGDQQPH